MGLCILYLLICEQIWSLVVIIVRSSMGRYSDDCTNTVYDHSLASLMVSVRRKLIEALLFNPIIF